jgi:Kef-type K+ transport system membrane component KefB
MREPLRATDKSRSPLLSIVLYCLSVIVTIAAFLAVRSYGQTLVAPLPATETRTPAAVNTSIQETPVPPRAQENPIPHVLLTLAAVILLGQLLARLFAFLHQPPVIGEVIAGIALGPSILGKDLSAWLLPVDAAPFLNMIAQLGVILYMFLVGLELNADFLRHRARTTVAISHASILAPFLLGSVLALTLYPRLSSADVSFTSFALFLGVAMSITAFPVLARILTDRGLSKTPLGILALSCAAADDVTAWCLLAFVTGVARAQFGEGLRVTLSAAAYIVVMLVFIRPIVKRMIARWDCEPMPRRTAAAVLIAMLLSSLATEWIGIHAIFGAFLMGAVIPHESAVARNFNQQLSHVVSILLLPAFFALTGMRTRIDLVTGLDQWLFCGLIILIATAGKFGGTWIAARMTGLSKQTAAALGILMNTRGLMELIVLNVGLDLHVISPTLFSMMVVMALVTTMITSPLLRRLTIQSADKSGDRNDQLLSASKA